MMRMLLGIVSLLSAAVIFASEYPMRAETGGPGCLRGDHADPRTTQPGEPWLEL